MGESFVINDMFLIEACANMYYHEYLCLVIRKKVGVLSVLIVAPPGELD